MIVGKIQPNNNIYQEKSQKSINYALNILKTSIIAKDITAVYLYGSAARGEQKYNSDVDLMVEIRDGYNFEENADVLRDLKSRAIPLDCELPEVDLKIVSGSRWKKNTSLYFKNIRGDGINIWKIPH